MRPKVGARVGSAGRSDESRSDAVAGDISKRDDPAAVGEGAPIVVVAAGVIGRFVPTRDRKARESRGIVRQEGLLNVAGGLEVALEAGKLLLGVGLSHGGFDVLANFLGDSAGDETGQKQNDGIQSDIGLRDGGGSAGSGWAPGQMNGGDKIRNRGGDARKPTQTRVQAENRKNNEDEKEESCGTRERLISRFNRTSGEVGDADSWERELENGGQDPGDSGKSAAAAQDMIDEAKHEKFDKRCGKDQRQGPSGLQIENGSVKKKDTN